MDTNAQAAESVNTAGERELKLNIVFGMGYQILTIVINYLTKQALKRTLGTGYLGMQTVFANFSDVLMFAFMGIGIAMLFRLYKPFADGDRKMLNGVFHYFNRVFRGFSIAVAVIGAAVSGLVVMTINADIEARKIVVCYLLYLFAVVIHNRVQVCFYYMMADQKRYMACIITAVFEAAAMFFQLAALYMLGSYTLFLIAILVKDVVTAIGFIVYMWRNYPYLLTEKVVLQEEEKKGALGNVGDMIITRVGNTLLNCTDSIITSSVVSTVMAGVYSNYYFIMTGITNLVVTFYDSVMAKLGVKLAADPEGDHFADYREMLAVNLLFAAAATSGFYNLSRDFITLWMGDDVILEGMVVVILTFNLHMSVMRNSAATYRQAAGLFSKISYLILFRGVFNIILSVILGLRMGLTGVILATTISDITTVYWYEPMMVYRHQRKKMFIELAYQFVGAILSLSSIYLSGLAVRQIHVSTWIGFLEETAVVAGICVLWGGFWITLPKIMRKLFRKKEVLR